MKKEVWKKVVAGAGIILALGVGAGCAKEKKEGNRQGADSWHLKSEPASAEIKRR
jgi:hypothetical protein